MVIADSRYRVYTSLFLRNYLVTNPIDQCVHRNIRFRYTCTLHDQCNILVHLHVTPSKQYFNTPTRYTTNAIFPYTCTLHHQCNISIHLYVTPTMQHFRTTARYTTDAIFRYTYTLHHQCKISEHLHATPQMQYLGTPARYITNAIIRSVHLHVTQDHQCNISVHLHVTPSMHYFDAPARYTTNTIFRFTSTQHHQCFKIKLGFENRFRSWTMTLLISLYFQMSLKLYCFLQI